MNIRSRQLINTFFDGLSTNQVKHGLIPSYVTNYVNQGLNYTRAGQYDEAVEIYVKAIDRCGYLVTEVGRMFAMTLCALNEYRDAIGLLSICLFVKMTDENRLNKTGNGSLDYDLARDWSELGDCMIAAAKGNLTPLFDRTKAVSGNPNYINVKSNEQIQNEVCEYCKAHKLI